MVFFYIFSIFLSNAISDCKNKCICTSDDLPLSFLVNALFLSHAPFLKYTGKLHFSLKSQKWRMCRKWRIYIKWALYYPTSPHCTIFDVHGQLTRICMFTRLFFSCFSRACARGTKMPRHNQDTRMSSSKHALLPDIIYFVFYLRWSCV